MSPLVLSHTLVQPFKFWYEGEIIEGMCSSQEIYRLSNTYKAEDRQKAFCLAVALTEHGAQVCVTCGRREYKVWVGLRTQNATASAFQEDITA